MDKKNKYPKPLIRSFQMFLPLAASATCKLFIYFLNAILYISIYHTVLFSVSTRRVFPCMRFTATREVRRGSIIMTDDLLSPVRCEDPPGIYSQHESFNYSFDLVMCPIKKAVSYKI